MPATRLAPDGCPLTLLAAGVALQVMHACWVRAPEERPSFEELKVQLEDMWQAMRQEDMKRHNQGFLSKLRKPK